MTVALVDPSLFGTDVSMVEDVAPVWGISTGFLNLARALARRLITDRGGLFYDLSYGFNTTDLLNAGWTPTLLQRTQQDVASECEKDERVGRCKADVVFNSFFQTLTINVTCTTAAGPFAMVMGVDAVTVQILKVNGVTLNETVSATTPATQVVVVNGGGGGVGPAGPPGPGGSAQASITFGDNIWFEDQGVETWQGQREINMGSLPGSLTVEFVAQVRSTSGTASFRLRLGGGDTAADGTVLATMTTASASFVEVIATASFTNPTGLKRLKVTAESSALGETAEIKGITVTFR